MSDNIRTGGNARWLKVVLFASLALNLLIAGVALGMIGFHSGRGGDGPPRIRDHTLFPLVAMLPRSDRAQLRQEMGPREGHRPEWRRHRSDILRYLRGDPFNAEGFAAHLAERRSARNAAAEQLERALADYIAAMPREAREDYAERVERLGWDRKSRR